MGQDNYEDDTGNSISAFIQRAPHVVLAFLENS